MWYTAWHVGFISTLLVLLTEVVRHRHSVVLLGLGAVFFATVATVLERSRTGLSQTSGLGWTVRLLRGVWEVVRWILYASLGPSGDGEGERDTKTETETMDASLASSGSNRIVKSHQLDDAGCSCVFAPPLHWVQRRCCRPVPPAGSAATRYPIETWRRAVSDHRCAQGADLSPSEVEAWIRARRERELRDSDKTAKDGAEPVGLMTVDKKEGGTQKIHTERRSRNGHKGGKGKVETKGASTDMRQGEGGGGTTSSAKPPQASRIATAQKVAETDEQDGSWFSFVTAPSASAPSTGTEQAGARRRRDRTPEVRTKAAKAAPAAAKSAPKGTVEDVAVAPPRCSSRKSENPPPSIDIQGTGTSSSKPAPPLPPKDARTMTVAPDAMGRDKGKWKDKGEGEGKEKQADPPPPPPSAPAPLECTLPNKQSKMQTLSSGQGERCQPRRTDGAVAGPRYSTKDGNQTVGCARPAVYGAPKAHGRNVSMGAGVKGGKATPCTIHPGGSVETQGGGDQTKVSGNGAGDKTQVGFRQTGPGGVMGKDKGKGKAVEKNQGYDGEGKTDDDLVLELLVRAYAEWRCNRGRGEGNVEDENAAKQGEAGPSRSMLRPAPAASSRSAASKTHAEPADTDARLLEMARKLNTP